jgi:tetratricopeptide (TPR) repeat protein
MIKRLIITTLLTSTFFLTPALAEDKATSFKEYLEQANSYIKSYRHFEASDALKEATKLGGAKHPSLHMRLGILYYGLGLIPEAIAEGERAVHLAPSSKWYKYDLANFTMWTGSLKKQKINSPHS